MLKITLISLIPLILFSCATPQPVSYRDEIKTAVRAGEPEYTECYKNHIKLLPASEGKIVLMFGVNESGKISNVEVVKEKTTLHDEQLQACLMDALKKGTYPPAPKGQIADVMYPFIFKKEVK